MNVVAVAIEERASKPPTVCDQVQVDGQKRICRSVSRQIDRASRGFGVTEIRERILNKLASRVDVCDVGTNGVWESTIAAVEDGGVICDSSWADGAPRFGAVATSENKTPLKVEIVSTRTC